MIKLREYRESDLETLVALANDRDVARYLTDTFPHPYTKQDAEWWLLSGIKTGIVRVIEFNGEFVGSVGAIPMQNERRFSASVGYWLGRPYWGKGIARRALEALTEYVFEHTEIVRLCAGVFSPNRSSMRVLDKAGYKFEGVLQRSVYKDGEFYDEHIYAKLKPFN